MPINQQLKSVLLHTTPHDIFICWMSLRKRGWTRVAIAKMLKIDNQPAHRFGYLLIGQVQERIIFPAFQVYIIIKLSFSTTMLLNLATETLQCRLRKCNDAKIPDTVSLKKMKKIKQLFWAQCWGSQNNARSINNCLSSQ